MDKNSPPIRHGGTDPQRGRQSRRLLLNDAESFGQIGRETPYAVASKAAACQQNSRGDVSHKQDGYATRLHGRRSVIRRL